MLDLSNTAKISIYKNDGFVKVVDVCPSSQWFEWKYLNVHPHCLSNHDSWVYMICARNRVVKIGETNLTLLVRGQYVPYLKIKGRFGRLTTGDGTDHTIRSALAPYVTAGEVSIWARQCQINRVDDVVGGVRTTFVSKQNQQAEKAYLDHYYHTVGCYPPLNNGRA